MTRLTKARATQPTQPSSAHTAVIARLSPEQVHRICEHGGRIEVTTSRMDEGHYPRVCGFLYLEWPGALHAFFDALLNKDAALGPTWGAPGLGKASQLLVCGFLDAKSGAFLVSSITPGA